MAELEGMQAYWSMAMHLQSKCHRFEFSKKARLVPSHSSTPPTRSVEGRLGLMTPSWLDATVGNLWTVNHVLVRRDYGLRLTDHAAGSAIGSKELRVGHRVRQPH